MNEWGHNTFDSICYTLFYRIVIFGKKEAEKGKENNKRRLAVMVFYFSIIFFVWSHSKTVIIVGYDEMGWLVLRSKQIFMNNNSPAVHF